MAILTYLCCAGHRQQNTNFLPRDAYA